MYESPRLKRYGTMQELTQSGCSGSSDGVVFNGDVGIGLDPIINGSSTSYCFASPVS